MFNVAISHSVPQCPDNLPARYAVMFDMASEFADDGDLYVVVTLNGAVVGMAQLGYKRHLSGYELKALVSMFPHAGKLAFGRALAIARHDGQNMTIYSLPKAEGFYDALPVCRKVSNATYVA